MTRDQARPRQGQQDDDANPTRHQGDAPPFWEWVMAGFGALLLVAAVAYLLFEAVVAPRQPPLPQVEVRETVRRGDAHVVEVRVHNRGRMPAAQLRITGTLEEQGRESERSEAEFDFVPGRSWRDASLLFRQDPAGKLRLRVESYQKP